MLTEKFAELITILGQSQGPVAIIIDEYDKPIVDLIEQPEHAKAARVVLKDFYGVPKNTNVDHYTQLLFITGVSKFSKITLFSDINNLKDLTNDTRAAALVGYTNQDVDSYFVEHIEAFAAKQHAPYAYTRQVLKDWYNGYRFSDAPTKVYNPFSLHNCLLDQELHNYWFTSGTPTFLIKFIEHNPAIAADIETIDGSFFSEENLDSFTIDLYYQHYTTLLLQTGYLTFASGYDADRRGYIVAYPNEEVRYAMTQQIMHYIGGIRPQQFGEFGSRFRKALATDDLGLFCKHLQDFIKLVPHTIRVDREKFYHQIFLWSASYLASVLPLTYFFLVSLLCTSVVKLDALM